MLWQETAKTFELPTEGNPDLYFLNQIQLGIEESRSILKWIGIRPVYSRKVCIVAVDELTVEAQNSLLKILEEPPFNSVFFLVTSPYSFLLPTLVSRLQQIDDMVTNRTGVDPVKAEEFLNSSPAERIKLVEDIIQQKDARKGFALLSALERELYRKTDRKDQASFLFLDRLVDLKDKLNRRPASLKPILEYVAAVAPYGK